jgi:hypothetical protein
MLASGRINREIPSANLSSLKLPLSIEQMAIPKGYPVVSLPMSIQVVRGNKEDRGNRDFASPLSLFPSVQFFAAIAFSLFAIIDSYIESRARAQHSGARLS